MGVLSSEGSCFKFGIVLSEGSCFTSDSSSDGGSRDSVDLGLGLRLLFRVVWGAFRAILDGWWRAGGVSGRNVDEELRSQGF